MAVVPLPRPIYFGLISQADNNVGRLVGDGAIYEELGNASTQAYLGLLALWGNSAVVRYRFPPTRDVCIGAHGAFNAGGANTGSWWEWRTEALGVVLHMRPDANGFLNFYRGSGTTDLIATTTRRLTVGPWAFIEAAVHVDGSGGTLDVWINGSPDISLSGIDTGNQDVAIVQFTGNNVRRLGDGYMVEASGPTAALGPILWTDKRPNSDESPQDWAPTPTGDAFATLNEANSNNSTNFVRSLDGGDRSRFGMTPANLEVPPPFIYAYGFANLPDGGSDQLVLRVHSDTSEAESDPLEIAPAAWSCVGWPFAVDPATSSPWAPAAVDAAEIEIEHEENV